MAVGAGGVEVEFLFCKIDEFLRELEFGGQLGIGLGVREDGGNLFTSKGDLGLTAGCLGVKRKGAAAHQKKRGEKEEKASRGEKIFI